MHATFYVRIMRNVINFSTFDINFLKTQRNNFCWFCWRVIYFDRSKFETLKRQNEQNIFTNDVVWTLHVYWKSIIRLFANNHFLNAIEIFHETFVTSNKHNSIVFKRNVATTIWNVTKFVLICKKNEMKFVNLCKFITQFRQIVSIWIYKNQSFIKRKFALMFVNKI